MISSFRCLRYVGSASANIGNIHRITSSQCSNMTDVCNTSLSSRIQNTGLMHTTACFQYPGKDWRKKHGKPLNPNAYGPLTDGPDYSFLDGRPAPVGSGKLKRARDQRDIASKIMQLTSEVDLAVENYAAEVKNENERKTKIIKNKLKPKGGIPPEAV